jgi:hypothetical protein
VALYPFARATTANVDRWWQSFLRRFDLEHTSAVANKPDSAACPRPRSTSTEPGVSARPSPPTALLATPALRHGPLAKAETKTVRYRLLHTHRRPHVRGQCNESSRSRKPGPGPGNLPPASSPRSPCPHRPDVDQRPPVPDPKDPTPEKWNPAPTRHDSRATNLNRALATTTSTNKSKIVTEEREVSPSTPANDQG